MSHPLKKKKRYYKEKFEINKLPLLDIGCRDRQELTEYHKGANGLPEPWVPLYEYERTSTASLEISHYVSSMESHCAIAWVTSNIDIDNDDDSILDIESIIVDFHAINQNDFDQLAMFKGYGVGNALWFEIISPYREKVNPYPTITTAKHIPYDWRIREFEYKTDDERLLGDIWDSTSYEDFKEIFGEE